MDDLRCFIESLLVGVAKLRDGTLLDLFRARPTLLRYAGCLSSIDESRELPTIVTVWGCIGGSRSHATEILPAMNALNSMNTVRAAVSYARTGETPALEKLRLLRSRGWKKESCTLYFADVGDFDRVLQAWWGTAELNVACICSPCSMRRYTFGHYAFNTFAKTITCREHGPSPLPPLFLRVFDTVIRYLDGARDLGTIRLVNHRLDHHATHSPSYWMRAAEVYVKTHPAHAAYQYPGHGGRRRWFDKLREYPSPALLDISREKDAFERKFAREDDDGFGWNEFLVDRARIANAIADETLPAAVRFTAACAEWDHAMMRRMHDAIGSERERRQTVGIILERYIQAGAGLDKLAGYATIVGLDGETLRARNCLCLVVAAIEGTRSVSDWLARTCGLTAVDARDASRLRGRASRDATSSGRLTGS
jgi:hypothetical protein